MTAVDTNVIVRLLTQDHRDQAARARAIFAAAEVWIAKSVLLETSWVLRSVYGFSEKAVQTAFTRLLGLPNVRMEDEVVVAKALSLLGSGIEFADALHLESTPPGALFVPFDETFVRRARSAGVPHVALVGPKK